MQDYSRAAHLYETRYTEEQNLKIKTVVEALRSGKRDPAAKKAAILDLGCGTGLLFPQLKTMARSIVALDLSRRMLKEAGDLGKDFGDVHFILADADNTPIREDQFDFVIALTLLQNMPIPERSLQEAQRVAKEESTLAVTGLKAHFTRGAFVAILRKARLESKLLKTTDDLKDHIAICKRCAQN